MIPRLVRVFVRYTTHMTYEHYGLRMRELRLSRNMTLVEFARQTGLYPSNVSIYEHGRKKARHTVIVRVAVGLGLDVKEELKHGGLLQTEENR